MRVMPLKVLIKIGGGPEIDEADVIVPGADTVDAPKPLDDADGVPMDVVIDEEIGVLEVLALTDAVGGD